MNKTTEQIIEFNNALEELLVLKLNTTLSELYDIHTHDGNLGIALSEIQPESLATLTENVGRLVEVLKTAQVNTLPKYWDSL